MIIQAAKKAAALLILFPLLSACGDMDAMFSSGNSYRIRARASGMSLGEDTSIIRSRDRIFPYFAVPVINDPDVTGIWAYLRNRDGEIVGHRVRYSVGLPASETSETESAEGEGDAIVEISVRSFGHELPPFSLPGNMEIGPHTLVFEVLGNRMPLRRTEIPVFYLGNAEFAIRDISMSLPGVFGSQLVPPGTKVLLEARLNFDSRLDPYLIWHSGRSVIHAGRLREGADSVLWEAPIHAAFHPLRLEILPVPDPGRRSFLGISREILLPVSANAETVGFFFGTGSGRPARNRLAEGLFHLEHMHAYLPDDENEADAESAPEPPELLKWYQFQGRLHDTMSAQDEERFVAPVGEHVPRWASMGQNFGLSTCYDQGFALSPVNFFREGQDHGGGIFLFHVRPIAEGTIFSAFFPAHSPGGGAWLDLSRKDDAIVLRLGTAETTIEVPVFLSPYELRRLLPIAVKFYLHPDRMEANLGLGENAFLQSVARDVPLRDALTGKGVARLGGAPLDSWTQTPARVFTGLARLRFAPPEDPPGAITVADADAGFPDSEPEEDADAPEEFPESDFPAWNEIDEIEDPQPAGMEDQPVAPFLTTIWNEFAVMLSSTPFPRPKLAAEDAPEDEESRAEETTAEAQGDDPATPLAIAIPEIESPEPGAGAMLYENTDADTRAETLS